MFAQSNIPDMARKRFRDDDEEAIVNQCCGVAEHRTKRLYLPVRSSNHADAASQWSSSPNPDTTPRCDVDMAMDENIVPLHSPQPGRNGLSLEPNLNPNPNPLRHSLDNLTGRSPTPVQPNFAPQVRDPSGWSDPVQTISHTNGVVNMGHVSDASQDRAVPRTMQGEDAWPAAVHHRIPSPTSEAESCPDRASAATWGTGDHDVSAGHADQGDTGMMEASLLHGQDSQFGVPTEPGATSVPATPSPGRSRGHVRSLHTVNSWTWQPGMKRSFSMGYRADCEKCRLKVPGHFNHIVIS
ncbi:hypothetical protein SODALDRAFT_19755 [Sodiomyces alkalinus F11]|uniref:Uncharacterized protein n=1 Tax=Sodiomyces alkalinus (strain CBS 110278 / VKM F-3762 / F11) TaxID=1314773 RepID=A0A3N2Q7B1_SODAK|nr:hypothetical protein SODALDRAFT_19755 [Sodiomyces alkalinus F11]ROT42632.1 hypothetical protein SODALDRAFT_19755 [Sodiomyces alkalinus F11]